jgi:ribosomal protein S6
MTTDTTTQENAVEAPQEEVSGDEKRVYEIGYHLVPTLDERARGDAVDALRKAVEDRGGLILNEVYPELIDLSYEMTHDMLGKRHRFETAYFGWMFVELSGGEIPEIERYLQASEQILRALAVQTTREHALASTSYSFNKEGSFTLHTEEEEEVEDREEEDKGELSEEEVDKAIDDLVKDEVKEELKEEIKEGAEETK